MHRAEIGSAGFRAPPTSPDSVDDMPAGRCPEASSEATTHCIRVEFQTRRKILFINALL